MHTIFKLLKQCKPSSSVYAEEILSYSRGMGTVYIQRTTEDLDEDMATVQNEVDLFIDGTSGHVSHGLGELADILA